MASIVTVCTGNICRSPAAEVLLREYLGTEVSIASAGTHAMVGHGIPPEMLTPLDAVARGGHEHRAQQFVGELGKQATIIIAMAAEHRTRIVQEEPALLKRTFLLDELAQAARASALLEGANLKERLQDVPAAIQAFRPELAAAGVLDVPDPYRRSQADYNASFAMIDSAVRDFSKWLQQ